MSCSVRPALDDWARCGCNVELPPELTLHARICRTCWQFVTQVTAARQMAAKLPVHRIAPTRVHTIRAILRQETRLPLHVEVEARRRRPRFWFAMGAIGLLAGAAGVAAVRVGGQQHHAPTVATARHTVPAVTVRLSAGARGQAKSPRPDSPYELEDGQGEFDVVSVGDGRVFRVVAGGYVVEAHRARFRLHVSNAALVEIVVVAGHVAVQQGESTVATLGEGQSLSPPALSVVRAPPAARETSLVDQFPAATRGAPSVSVPHSNQGIVRTTRQAPDDREFAEAFRLLGVGLPEKAATAFDVLLGHGTLDASRRADVLYWSCQAHARSGHAGHAEARARTYIESYPNSLHYGDVALLLGDYARGRGATATASDYYTRALRATHPATRARAEACLKSIREVG